MTLSLFSAWHISNLIRLFLRSLGFYGQIQVNLGVGRVTQKPIEVACLVQPKRILGLQRYQFLAFIEGFLPLLALFQQV